MTPGKTTFITHIRLRDAGELHATPVLKPPGRLLGGEAVPGSVGPYPIVGEIARGGVGAVFKARDPDLGRDIALKILLEKHREIPGMLARFFEEAQIGAQLQHPGIVPVHDVGLSGGAPYFTMKLLKGRTLAALLEERRDPAEGRQRLIGIFEQVCQTVAYAHARKVVHRDLKPANIMVGAYGEVQVLDWGLGKVLTGSTGREADGHPPGGESGIETVRSGSPASASLAGSVFGTPAYMSPEQARGALEEADERSDVFSLGALLCEILSGRPPYTGESSDAVLHKSKRGYLDEAFARLDACGAEEPLIELARRCLAYEARARPRHAGEVAKEVGDYLTALEARVRASAAEAAAARVRGEEERKARRLILALVALVLLAIGGGGWTYVHLGRLEKERSASAERSVREALGEARERRAQASLLVIPDTGKWEEALDAARRAASLAGGAAAAADLAGEARRLEEEIEGEAASARSRLEEAERDRAMVLQLEGLRAERMELRAPLYIPYRKAFLAYGIDVEGVEPAAAAERIRSSAISLELTQALDAWAMEAKDFHGRASGLWRKILHTARLADPDPLRLELRQALEAGDDLKLSGLASKLMPEKTEPASLAFLSGALRLAGEYPAADGVLRSARLAHPGDAVLHWLASDLRSSIAALALHPQSSTAFLELASRRWERGENERHLAHAREAVRLASQDLATWNLLGIGLSDRGDHQGALRAYAKALEIDPHQAMLHNNIGVAKRHQDDLEGSTRALREACRFDPGEGVLWRNLGDVLSRQSDHRGAVAAWREALRVGVPSRAGVSAAEALASLHDSIGLTLLDQLEDAEGAMAHFREAMALSSERAEPPAGLCRALFQLGRPAEALENLGEALDREHISYRAWTQALEILDSRSSPQKTDGSLDEAVAGLLLVIHRLEEREEAFRVSRTTARRVALAALAFLARSGSPGRALELAEREVAEMKRDDADVLLRFGRILELAGRQREAIVRLEEAAALPDSLSIKEQLTEARTALLPDLVTYASIDAALESMGSEKLLPEGELWKYFRGRGEPSPALEWTRLDFDDGQWESGRSGFGFGDGDDATVLDDMQYNYPTIYIRKRFEVPDAERYGKVELEVTVDDGFVAYLNGEEVGRYNAGRPGERHVASALASSVTTQPVAAPALNLSGKLKRGENLLALQGLNRTLDSSDLSLLPVLRAELDLGLEERRRRLAPFRETASGRDGDARKHYAEARLLQRQGDLGAAAAELEKAIEADPEGVEPRVRLAECLRSVGKLAEAESMLRRSLAEGRARGTDRLFQLWLEIFLGDLGQSAAAALEAIPPDLVLPEGEPAGDTLWALRELRRAGAIRLNCGGEEYLASDGRRWSRDRFYGEPSLVFRTGEKIGHTADSLLYQTVRESSGWGLPLDYRIPAGDGLYLVHLHWSEWRYIGRSRRRVFDVLLEGRRFLTWDLDGKTYFSAHKSSFLVLVEDGFLDVAIHGRRLVEPFLSALEIEAVEREEALKLAAEQVEASARNDAEALGLLAEALILSGRKEEALGVLEEAAPLPGFTERHQELLESCRGALLPDLPTFASLEAAILEPESIIPKGASWRYFKGLRPPSDGLGWTLPAFDDREWTEGTTPFGHGAAGNATLLGDMRNVYTTLYLRRSFEIEDLARFEKIELSVAVDGGFVAYLNGEEVGRRRAGPRGLAPGHTSPAQDEGAEPITPGLIDLTGRLQAGKNLLAIQGLCFTIDSASFSILPILAARPRPGLTPESPRLREFLASARGPGAALRRDYLEARLLQLSGKNEEAAPRLEAIVQALATAGKAAWEPSIHLARAHRALGQSGEASDVLRDAVSRSGRARADVLDLWLDALLFDLKRGAAGALEALPAKVVYPEKGGAAERLWVLRELEEHGAVRLNCGGDEYRSADGTIWREDRFFLSGRNPPPGVNGRIKVRRTIDDGIHRVQRWFYGEDNELAHYSLPLPPGRYRVRLHFSEILLDRSREGGRVFDVLLEEERVLERFDMGAEAGHARAIVKEFTPEVDDGALEIRFARGAGTDPRPMISAIEIAPLHSTLSP